MVSVRLLIMQLKIMKSNRSIISIFFALVAGVFIFVFSIVLRIDFMIGLGDTLFTFMLVLGVLLGTAFSIVRARSARNSVNVLVTLMVCSAVVGGIIVGNKMLMTQFYEAQEYVEQLAGEITSVEENDGVYPDNLFRLDSYDPSGSVPVGLFRKRPLRYAVQEGNKGFVLSFPFSTWMIAYYDGISGQWHVDD